VNEVFSRGHFLPGFKSHGSDSSREGCSLQIIEVNAVELCVDRAFSTKVRKGSYSRLDSFRPRLRLIPAIPYPVETYVLTRLIKEGTTAKLLNENVSRDLNI
jgi:hypothetical protein